MEVVTNRYVTIKTHIDGSPDESDLEVRSEALALAVEPGTGSHVIVKAMCVSVDPYQINRMKTRSISQKAIKDASGINPGEVILAPGVGKVVASGCPEYKKGDLVIGHINWGEYSTVSSEIIRKLDPMGFPLSYHLGVLGLSGLTAYIGLFELCKPKEGERVFVSTACGSVGNLVGQYAKLFGCYVVGCAGSDDKVALLKEKLCFDDAFNYKEETDFNSALGRRFPDGIDIYFDNVGGEMLEAAVANMNNFGRIAACGVMSEYTGSGKKAAPDMMDVVYKRIKIQGFLVPDHRYLHPEFMSTTCDYLRSGKLQVLEDISHGLESIPSAFTSLFRGQNVGKTVVVVSKE